MSTVGPKTLITGLHAVRWDRRRKRRKLRATKVLVLTDPGVAECGNVESVQKPLTDAGLDVGVYDHAVPEPPMGTLHEGIEFVEKDGYDCIVGLRRRLGDRRGQDDRGAGPHRAHHVQEYVGVDMVPRKGLPLIASRPPRERALR